MGARLARGVAGAAGAELIGERQDQRAQRVLVVGIDREDVAADALGLRRIVEQAVALGLLERVRDAVGRDRLELEAHVRSSWTCSGRAAGAAAAAAASSARVFVRLRMPNSLRPMIATGS